MIKCWSITSFTNYVAVIFASNDDKKTKLFKTTFNKVEEVTEFFGEFRFDAGVLRTNSEKYVLPTQSLEVKTGIKKFQTENWFYTFFGDTNLKNLITDEIVEYQIEYLLKEVKTGLYLLLREKYL